MKKGLVEAISIAPMYFNNESINYEFACLIILYSTTLIEAERKVSNHSFLKTIIREVGGSNKRERSKPERFMNTQELKEKNIHKKQKKDHNYKKKNNKNKRGSGAGRKDRKGQKSKSKSQEMSLSMSEDEIEMDIDSGDEEEMAWNNRVNVSKRKREASNTTNNISKQPRDHDFEGDGGDDDGHNGNIDSNNNDENENYYKGINNDNDNDNDNDDIEKLDDEGLRDLGEFTSSQGRSMLDQIPHSFEYPDKIKDWKFSDAMNHIKQFGTTPPVALSDLKQSNVCFKRFK